MAPQRRTAGFARVTPGSHWKSLMNGDEEAGGGSGHTVDTPRVFYFQIIQLFKQKNVSAPVRDIYVTAATIGVKETSLEDDAHTRTRA